MTNTFTLPPFDPELQPVLALLADSMPPMETPEDIPLMRRLSSNDATKAQLAEMGLTCRDVTVEGYGGAPLVATVVARHDHQGTGPGIYHMHGGGMVSGVRMDGVLQVAPWVLEYGAVAVTVEYRLAPEHPAPVPVEDCYAGLVWMADHSAEIGVDSERMLLVGASAGGGLAAGVALMARDRRGPSLIGQLLDSPMLDDRLTTPSALAIDGVHRGVFDRKVGEMCWDALLGDRRGTANVSIYDAPGRATDLAGLPPAFIDCGSMEVFRDENVAYASALWAAGVPTELHVWPGGFHGFDSIAPHTALAHVASDARNAWVDRLLRVD